MTLGYLGSFASRGSRSPKYYINDHIGVEGYNPVVVEYYDSAHNLVRVEETFRESKYCRTISGTLTSASGIYTQNWPNYTYTIVRKAIELTITTLFDDQPTQSGVDGSSLMDGHREAPGMF